MKWTFNEQSRLIMDEMLRQGRYTNFGQSTIGTQNSTPSGVIAFSSVISRNVTKTSLSGGVLPRGDIRKRQLVLKTAALTFAGRVVFNSPRNLTGSINPVGVIAPPVSRINNFIGSLGLVGQLVKRPTLTTLSGSTNPNGDVVNTGALKVFISHQFSPSGSILNKESYKRFSGVFSPTGSIIRSNIKTVVATLGFTSGNLQTSKVMIVNGILRSTGRVGYDPRKSLSGNVTPQSTLSRVSLKVLDGTLDITSSLIRVGRRVLSGLISPVSTIGERVNKATSGFMYMQQRVVSRSTQKSTVGELTPEGTAQRARSILVQGGIEVWSTLTNYASRAFSEARSYDRSSLFTGAVSRFKR